MGAPKNRLKQAMRDGQMQIGVWLNLGSTGTAEIAAGAGFDWCCIDAEHGPYDVTAIRDQLIAIGAHGPSAMVRVPADETWMIKQVLDFGAQTLLVPMVDTPEQAREIVSAAQYPPAGIRGMGAAVARASNYSGIADYIGNANDEICVIVQAETSAALENLDAILAVDGIDGVFIGPADLSANMGFPGRPDAPEVIAAIEDAIGRIRAAGKAAGFLDFDPASFARYAALGVTVLAVGSDALTLAQGLRRRAAEARQAVAGG